MSSLKGKWIEVQGYKHDGGMHRIWDPIYVVNEEDDFVITCSKTTKVIEHNFRMWNTKEPAIMIFSFFFWWNVIAMLKSIGIVYYVNLASPIIIDNMKIKYIDYDLDLKLFPNNKIKLIDVREYDLHRKLYNYGEDIDKILRFNMKEIKELMENKKFPFNDEIIKNYYHQFLKEINIKNAN